MQNTSGTRVKSFSLDARVKSTVSNQPVVPEQAFRHPSLVPVGVTDYVAASFAVLELDFFAS